MSRIALSLLIVAVGGCALDFDTDETTAAVETCEAGEKVFVALGAYDWATPSGCTSISVKAWGGGGDAGAAWNGATPVAGGGGGFVRARLPIAPQETLHIQLAGPGRRTAVWRGNQLLVVAGGGGAGGVMMPGNVAGAGGAGGGTVGEDGGDVAIGGNTATGGRGGFQNQGGAGGVSSTGHNGAPGVYLWGGTAYPNGGYGGDGYYGGGGAAVTYYGNAGGGGGSSFAGPGITIGGSGSHPGGQSDRDRSGAGEGGTPEAAATGGRLVIQWGERTWK